MIRKTLLILATVAVMLAACASPATPAPAATQPPATATLSPAADPPTATSEPATEAAPRNEAQPASGDDIRTYKIVPAESTVSYAVGEVFINQGNKFNVAIGITNVIEGELHLNFTHPELSTVGTIAIDISAFKSDSGRRDRAIQNDWLESARYPIATFTPTEITGFPSDAKEGDEITFQITGDLLVRDAARPITWDVTARLDGDTLAGTATTTILMSDFNFEAPDIGGILKAENEAKLEFRFVAKP